MEFWEGAILLVGGIWLVGRMHRHQTGVAAPATAAPVGMPSHRVPGPTSETNTDGSGYLVAGESLHVGTVTPAGAMCSGCGSSALPVGSQPQPRSYVQKPLAVQF